MHALAPVEGLTACVFPSLQVCDRPSITPFQSPRSVTTPFNHPLSIASLLQVNLVYYLEDDTLAVTEPQVLNSGLPQQKVLRRHRVPRSALSSEVDVVTLPGMAPRDFVTWRDLRCVA